jgi:hypothetical protein
MRSDDASDRLRELLARAGVNLEQPTHADVGRTWDVMRRFAREPADDVPSEPGDYDDGILAQYGVYDWSGTGRSEWFELDMTRQFSFYDEEGEYDHMAQLACTFRFEPTAALRDLGEADLWSFDMDLDAFFDEALAMPGFVGVRNFGVVPASLVIHYGDV